MYNNLTKEECKKLYGYEWMHLTADHTNDTFNFKFNVDENTELNIVIHADDYTRDHFLYLASTGKEYIVKDILSKYKYGIGSIYIRKMD